MGKHCKCPSQGAEAASADVCHTRGTWVLVEGQVVPSGVAGTRGTADLAHYGETSLHLEMEAQPLGAELPAGEF